MFILCHDIDKYNPPLTSLKKSSCKFMLGSALICVFYAVNRDWGPLVTAWKATQSIRKNLVATLVFFLYAIWAMISHVLVGGREILKSHWRLLVFVICFTISLHFVCRIEVFLAGRMVSDTVKRTAVVAFRCIWFVLFMICCNLWLWVKWIRPLRHIELQRTP
jgi:hypothetical protein